MSAFLDEVPRPLKERSDQSNLIERIAGQAVRDLPRPKPLSATTLARIAASLDQPVPAARRQMRHRWALVTAAFLMGIATAASAQRLDGLRQWLMQIVSLAPRPPERQSSPRPTLRRRPAKPAPSAGAAGEAVAAAPSDQEAMLPAPTAAPLAGNPGPSTDRRTAAGPRPVEGAAPRSTAGLRTGAAGTPAARPVQLAYVDRQQAPQPPSHAVASPAVVPDAVANVHVQPSPSLSVAEEGLAKPDPIAAPIPGPVAPAPSLFLPQVVDGTAAVAPGLAAGAKPQAIGHLTQAVRALRVERSPGKALLLLDRHAEELERNAFGREALVLRVEAMLALGRRAEALRLLDGAALTDATAARALLVIRGQLRAAGGRCAEALADFSLVLGEARHPPKAALLGRARCRKLLGDGEGARADLERYRLEFPGEGPRDERRVPGGRP